MESAGERLRSRIRSNDILALVGAYDMFSARIAAQRFEGVFCSGFGFAASAYGLPDIGFLTWRDLVEFAARMRAMLPAAHILVDVDDGFGDERIAAHTVHLLERAGASAVLLEDQRRPRRCGHADGKQVLPVDEYLGKLRRVLQTRRELVVVARTDAEDPDEGVGRAVAYAQAGADAVMVEAVPSLEVVRALRRRVDRPILVNQVHGGKSPSWSLQELQDAGASIVVYSTPCLFAAQLGVEAYLDALAREGRLPAEGTSTLRQCEALLAARFERS